MANGISSRAYAGTPGLSPGTRRSVCPLAVLARAPSRFAIVIVHRSVPLFDKDGFTKFLLGAYGPRYAYAPEPQRYGGDSGSGNGHVRVLANCPLTPSHLPR